MSRPTIYPHKKLLQLDDKLLKEIEDFRFSRRFNKEAEAIRELIRLGLERAEEEAKGGKA